MEVQFLQCLMENRPKMVTAVQHLNVTAGKFRPGWKKTLDVTMVEYAAGEFKEWLGEVFENQPVSADIVALNFGLFETDSGVGLYVTGSKEWDPHDDDWACRTDYTVSYFPGWEISTGSCKSGCTWS